MADCWRRADYDWTRRGSHPNPTWRRDPSPPRRPSGPFRSNTMDSSRDPRKRPSSRSPDRGQGRKQLKHGHSNNGSRQSSLSVSDGPPRQPRAMASSPSATTNLNGDTSGRSTPHSKSNSAAHPLAENTTGTVMKDSHASTGPDAVLELLANFTSQVAKQAAFQIARDQAESRANRLQLEYNENRAKFADFPAIGERKKSDKDAAQRDFVAKEKALNEHMTSQAHIMSSLANMISQDTRRTDQVSRAEYDSLSKTCNGLQLNLNAATSRIDDLRTQLAKAENSANTASNASKAVVMLQDQVRKLEQDIDTFRSWKDRSEPILREFKRVSDAPKEVHSVRNQLEAFKDMELKKLATKESLGELETQYEKLEQDVVGVKKSVGQIQAQSVASSVAQLGPKAVDDIDSEFKLQVQRLSEQGPGLVKKVEDLEKKTIENEKSLFELVAFTKGEEDRGVDVAQSLVEKIEDLYCQLDQTRESIGQIKDDVQEEGKEPLVKRVKNFDKLFNNIASEIRAIQPEGKPLIQQQLSKLAHDLVGVQHDVKRFQGNAPPPVYSATHSGTPVDLAPLKVRVDQCHAQLDHLITRLSEMEIDFAGKEQETIKHVGDEVAKVETIIANDKKSFEASLTALQREFSNVKARLSSTVSSEEFSALRGQIEMIRNESHERFRTLQALPQRGITTPTVSQTGPQPHATLHPQLSNSSVSASPQLTSNPSGSPVPNFAQVAPLARHGSPQTNGTTHLPQNILQEWRKMQAQLENLAKYNEHFVIVTQNLKQRCDNLQTDEIVRMMLDQLSQIYPHAKNFETAVRELQGTDITLRTHLNKLQSEKDDSVKQLNHLISDAKKASSFATLAVEKVSKTMEDHEKLANGLSNELKDLKSEVSRIQHSVQNTPAEVKTIQQDLTRVSKITDAAGESSKAFSSSLSKMSLEHEQMMATLGKHAERLDGHDKICKMGEQELKHARNDKEAIMKRVADYEGKVERLMNRNV